MKFHLVGKDFSYCGKQSCRLCIMCIRNYENHQQGYGPCVGNSTTLMAKHIFKGPGINKNNFYVVQELTKDLAILQ